VSAKIETKRTYLRRFTLEDLDDLVELESDEEVVRRTPMSVPQSRGESRQRLERIVAGNPRREPFGIWGAYEHESHSFVGWFMVIRRGGEHHELGFMLPRRCWNRGFATEIGSRLVRHATDEGLAVLDATVWHANEPSIRVLEKIGFELAETADKEGLLLYRYITPQVSNGPAIGLPSDAVTP
jgi:RimJ/RimL family protein N-acetyltransferase